MTTRITEVTARSTQGITRPFICRGDDGWLYFVKGNGAGRSSLISEWIHTGQRHRRLPPQARRNAHLLRVALAPPLQLLHAPSEPLQRLARFEQPRYYVLTPFRREAYAKLRREKLRRAAE